MTLCLDANVLVDVMRRRAPVVDRWQAMVGQGVSFVLPCVVLHELEAGVALSARPEVHRARLHELLAYAELVEFDVGDARASGRIRAGLQREGRPIGPLDTLIAGQALARGWTLVTRNVKHFGRVEGLPLIDWTVGPEPLSAQAIAARIREGD